MVELINIIKKFHEKIIDRIEISSWWFIWWYLGMKFKFRIGMLYVDDTMKSKFDPLYNV